MSAFYVGQRVRLVARRGERTISPSWRKPIGSEGVVSSVGPFCPGDLSWDGCRFESHNDVTVTWPDGMDLAYLSHQIEPILPEGWKVTDWDKCLWQPEGEIA